MRTALPLRPLVANKHNPILVVLLFLLWFVPLAKADTNVGGTIATDTAWTLAQSPYIVTSNITVKGTDGADGITTLTIEPGVEVRMTRYRQFIVGGSSGDPGALAAQGTAANPILFTSNEASPAVGDWYYIKFDNTSDDAGTVLEHCVVEYAGGSQGAIYLSNASPTIADTTVRFSKNAGIYGSGSGCATADINCNTFSNNKTGIYWMVSPTPEMHSNNFFGNTDYGIYYSGSAALNAENNWWGDAAGPNAGGDATYGNVDADPWSTAENQCNAGGENHPPNEPNTPDPADNAVRVQIDSVLTLSWSGGDPDVIDTVTYDLYWGTDSSSLALTAQDISITQHLMTDLSPGVSYFWKIVAKDNQGLETAGPVWRWTSDGDPPDLIISNLSLDPGGNIQIGQSVTVTAQIDNIGNGPVVDLFGVDFRVSGSSIGTIPVDTILLAGTHVLVSHSWTYNGGDPVIEVVADYLNDVAETEEGNNEYMALFTEAADNTPPVMTGHAPDDGAFLQQISQITVSLADSQSSVDDAAVTAGFSVTDAGHQPIGGTISESDDTFAFVPDTLPLADGTYQTNLTASDAYGNSQAYAFSFTIDTLAPAKPTITGGTVASGTIQPRPVQNTADDFMASVQGTREADTSVWINGAQYLPIGSGDWAVDLTLQQGDNALEVWCKDRAGNQSPSEWVDIRVEPTGGLIFEYNNAGRMKGVRRAE